MRVCMYASTSLRTHAQVDNYAYTVYDIRRNVYKNYFQPVLEISQFPL